MAQLQEALERLLAATIPLPIELVSVGDSHGRVAAEDVSAPEPVPHFPRPAMDGYVCHDADVLNASPGRPVILQISGAAPMGSSPGSGPAAGEAWTVTTGAPMPHRGDRVLPVEAVRRVGDQLWVEQPPGRRTHIAAPGEDIREGALLVAAGEVILPPAAGALAACGIRMVRVYRRPRVALVATGDELVDVGASAGPLPSGRVYNSNAATLSGLTRAFGCVVEYRGIVCDQPDELRATFAALCDGFDVVLSTGGVSIGRYDAVHRTWLDLGAQRIVGRVDLKPGGPFFAGRRGDTWAVGLSGTPVACLAAFHLLVRPFLARLSGRRHVIRPVHEGSLRIGFPRATDRMRALWARVEGADLGRPSVELLPGASTGNLAALLHANGLALIPPDTPPLPPGARVTVLMLDHEEDRDCLVITRPAMGPVVIGVVGESGSGKTTVVAEVVRRLTGDGMRVVTVKHAAHGFGRDRVGSDSARMADAGAALVVLAGPEETLLRFASPVSSPDRLVDLATALAEQVWGGPPALVLIEGFHHPTRPVIQVGPQKPGAGAGEVVAVVPALNGLSGGTLETELRRVTDMVYARIRPHAAAVVAE